MAPATNQKYLEKEKVSLYKLNISCSSDRARLLKYHRHVVKILIKEYSEGYFNLQLDRIQIIAIISKLDTKFCKSIYILACIQQYEKFETSYMKIEHC